MARDISDGIRRLRNHHPLDDQLGCGYEIRVLGVLGEEEWPVALHQESWAGKEAPEKYVMPSLAGLESGGKRGLHRQILQLMHDASVNRREVTNPAGRSFAKRSFYSLRLAFASHLANSGSSPKIRRKLTGHKIASVQDLYIHFEREVLRAAIHAILSLPEPCGMARKTKQIGPAPNLESACATVSDWSQPSGQHPVQTIASCRLGGVLPSPSPLQICRAGDSSKI